MRPDIQCSVRNHLGLVAPAVKHYLGRCSSNQGSKGPAGGADGHGVHFPNENDARPQSGHLAAFFYLFSSQRCACGALLIRHDVGNARRRWRCSRFIEQSQVAGVLRIPLLFCSKMTIAGVFGATNFNNFLRYRHFLNFWRMSR